MSCKKSKLFDEAVFFIGSMISKAMKSGGSLVRSIGERATEKIAINNGFTEEGVMEGIENFLSKHKSMGGGLDLSLKVEVRSDPIPLCFC